MSNLKSPVKFAEYVIPFSGYYQVCSPELTMRVEPTGRYRPVKNPRAKWYRPWEPPHVSKEIMNYRYLMEPTLRNSWFDQYQTVVSTHPPVEL